MKRIIAVLLVAVMFLGFVPFTAAAKTTNTTSVSEKNAFDYVADCIISSGEYKDGVYTCFVITELSASSSSDFPIVCRMIYNPEADRITYRYSEEFSGFDWEELGALEEPELYVEISFNRDSEKWDFLMYANIKTEYEVAYIKASTSFEPKTFDPWFIELDMDYYFEPEYYDFDISEIDTEGILCRYFDDFNNALALYFGINLGNFGFAEFTPAKLPDKIVDFADFEMNYKETAKFSGEYLMNMTQNYEYSEFRSSDESVAVVDDYGNVKAVGRGTAKIACKHVDENGRITIDTCTVTVKFTFWQWIIWILLLGFLWY